MTTTIETPVALGDVPPAIKRAVLYLRVSTPSQVKTDYDPEGISIPAQRVSCERKAEQMGVSIVGEYVEPGKSATTTDKRPVFKEMLDRLRSERDVDYVIVYELSRMNRNRIDDAKVLMLLRQHHVSLVSATESIDDTPAGQLMHGMLAAFNEFRSAKDGADIRYKMGQKAKNGGTIGRAPLGYVNVLQRFDGRDIRTVALDEDRAPLVRRVFDLYATNEYSLDLLHATIVDEGLTTRPFGSSRPGGPVSRAKLHQMLSDPYYVGLIEYQGALYPGRHEALVTQELFDKVQEVIAVRAGRGQRDRKYHHYLRGMLFCAHCKARGRESRLIYTLARGRSGERWEYFACRSKGNGGCDMRYLPVADVEEQITREYGKRELATDFSKIVRTHLGELLADDQTALKQHRTHVEMQLAKLDHAEERLLDLVSDGSLATAKVRTRMAKLQQDRARLKAEAETAGGQLALGAALLHAALDMVDEPEELYRQAPDDGRRKLNAAFFEKFYVDDDGVAMAVLTSLFADLDEANRRFLADRSSATKATTKKTPSDDEILSWSNADLLTADSSVGGSRSSGLVPPAGLEPAHMV